MFLKKMLRRYSRVRGIHRFSLESAVEGFLEPCRGIYWLCFGHFNAGGINDKKNYIFRA